MIAIGRNEAVLKELQDKHENRVITLNMDFNDLTSCEQITNALENKQLNYFIHSATTLEPVGASLKASPESFLQALQVNVLSAFRLMQLCHSFMTQGARVLNISSRVAKHPIRPVGIHCVTKSTMEALVNLWKKELGPKKVLFNHIYPGVVETPAQEKILRLMLAFFTFIALVRFNGSKELQEIRRRDFATTDVGLTFLVHEENSVRSFGKLTLNLLVKYR